MRYLPHTENEIQQMLTSIGIASLEDLFADVPTDCRRTDHMSLPGPLSEWQLNSMMDDLAHQMGSFKDYKNYTGAGSYEHYIPHAIPYLSSRSEFVTAYTPYQPEMSQGTLQAIFEYQTLTARLFGMEVANASLYDGASALAEALLMAIRITKKNKIAISEAIHPHYRQVIQTYFSPTQYEIITIPFSENGTTDLDHVKDLNDLACIALQSPNFFGCIENFSSAKELLNNHSALLIGCFTEALAYGLLKAPGSLGVDIICGDGMSFGISNSFGGPSLGMIACQKKYVRNIPGRLVGETKDAKGQRGFVLTLATREQHIRREKATSNICTNASHNALKAVMYMTLLGGSGLRKLAQLNLNLAEYLKNGLKIKGIALPFSSPTFNEFVVHFPDGFEKKYQMLLHKKIIAGIPLGQYYPKLKNHYLFCVTETKSKNDLDTFINEVNS